MPNYVLNGPVTDFINSYTGGHISNFKKFVSAYKKHKYFFDSRNIRDLIQTSIDNDDYEVFKFLLDEVVNTYYNAKETEAGGSGRRVRSIVRNASDVFFSVLTYYDFLEDVLSYTIKFAKFKFFKGFIDFFLHNSDYMRYRGVSIMYTTLISVLSDPRFGDCSKYKPFISVALSFHSSNFSSILMDKAEKKFK